MTIDRSSARRLLTLTAVTALGALLVTACGAAPGDTESAGEDTAATAEAITANSSIVISQIYGGGQNAPPVPYNCDYIQLFNRSNHPVTLTNWSIQYTSSTGIGKFSEHTNVIPTTTMQSQHYYLIRGGCNGTDTITPDFIIGTPISATAGKVVLSNQPTGIACNGGSTPCTPAQVAQMTDLVGFGTGTNFYEGSAPAPALTKAQSEQRVFGGCYDSNDNSKDFGAGTPVLLNSTSSYPLPCNAGTTTP